MLKLIKKKKKKSFRIQKYISSYIFISLHENKSPITKENHTNFLVTFQSRMSCLLSR